MIVGIDPGMKGAIAVRCEGWTRLYDIPTMKAATVSGNNKRVQNDIDIKSLINIVANINACWTDRPEIVVVCEHSAGLAFTSNVERGAHFDNSKTAFKKGYNFGIIRAVFTCYGLPFTHTPRPGDWKRLLKLTDAKLTYTQKKEKARLEAIRLFPALEQFLRHKKDADRAEALLLTVWAEKKFKLK